MGNKLRDLLASPVSIITFNYDRSLEYYLLTVMRTHIRVEEEAFTLTKNLPIVHVYGQLGLPDYYRHNRARPYRSEVSPPIIATCLSSMFLFTEGSKQVRQYFRSEQGLIDQYVRQAENLCFLGFGYNETNLRRLGIDENFTGDKILGTAYGLGADERKRVRDRLGIPDSNLGGPNEGILDFLKNHAVFS